MNKYIKKILTTFLILTGFIFLPINQNVLSTTKDFSVNLEISQNQIWKWIHLPATVDTIYLEFLDNQNKAFLETNSEKTIIKITKDDWTWFDTFEKSEDEKKLNFSQIFDIKNSNWIKIESKWAVKIFWWKKDFLKDEKNFFSKTENFLASIKNSISGIKIISRKQWNADESLKFNYSEWAKTKKTQYNISDYYSACASNWAEWDEKKYSKIIYNEFWKPLLWPHQYSSKIKKIVVHHTAEADNSYNLPWDQKIRAIYRYHTLTRKWWDIWYNYVIDQKWNIYEWRSGWDYVVWAHVKCNNIWTVWISLMWNFQNQKPTIAQLKSLSKLTAFLSSKYNIDITEYSTYHWKKSSNLLWHRDLAATACPWDNLYKKLWSIKKQIELSDFNFDIEETKKTSSYENIAEIKTDIWTIQIQPTSEKEIIFTYKNTSNKTWTKWTWLYVSDNTNKDLYVESIFPDKNYVAANLEQDKVYPWWIWHFKVKINSWYRAWLYSLEFVPIINWTTKFTKWTIIQPIRVSWAKNSYQFIQLKQPPREIFWGQSFTAKMILENTWNTKWFRSWDHAVTLKAYELWRWSTFVPKWEWSDDTILARLKEKSVWPWEFWTFEFFLRAPLKDWDYQEKFIPVIWKNTILWDRSMQFNIKVKKPNYRAQLLRESRENDFLAGQKKTIRIWLKNISDVEWESEQVAFRVIRSWWLKFDSFVYPITDFVPRHQAGFADVTIQAPTKAWNYTATLQALANWKNFDRLWRFELKINVTEAKLSWIITYLSTDNKNIYLKKWSEKKIIVRIKNKTNITWYKNWNNRISLRTLNSHSPLYSNSWIDENIVSTMKESKVSPWKTATFIFNVKANSTWNLSEKFFTRINSIWTIKWTEFDISVISWEKIKEKEEPKFQFKSWLSIQEKIKLMREKISNEKNSQKNLETSKKISENNKKILESTKKSSLLENSENNIKVKLSFPHNAINFWTSWNWEIKLDRQIISINKNNNIRVRSDWNKKIIISIDWKKYRWKKFSIWSYQDFVYLKNWNHSPWWTNKINDNFFRWKIEVSALDNKVKWKILVINNLDIEDYMKWIAEVPESSNHEKRKALSVISRSYASFYTKTKYRKFPWKNYDWSDDPNVFQKYLWAWYELRSPKWQLALSETKWEILRYNWEILKSAYFSCSNWKTKTPTQAWWKSDYFENKVSSVYQSVNDEYWKDMDRYRKKLCWHWVWLSWAWAETLWKMWWSYKKILYYYYQEVRIWKL